MPAELMLCCSLLSLAAFAYYGGHGKSAIVLTCRVTRRLSARYVRNARGGSIHFSCAAPSSAMRMP
jgi:hypothetical protein